MTLPPDFPPGAQWSYSNTGYVLLGVLIHRSQGSSTATFCRSASSGREAIARILHYGLRTGDKAFAYRFYLNAAGQVADFSSEER